MLENAIKKIKNEMEKENNPYVKVIGEYLLQVVKDNESAAEKILVEDKTIMKSLKEMEKAAQKVKVGNVGILTDEEGYEIVLKYFDISKEINKSINNENLIDFKSKKIEKQEEDILSISLDDYL